MKSTILKILIITLLITSFTSAKLGTLGTSNDNFNIEQALDLTLTAETNKVAYELREPIAIHGNFLEDTQPVTDSIVSIEIRDPNGDEFAYRTLSIGNPQQFWQFNISEIKVTNQNDELLEVVEINSAIKLSITVDNIILSQRTAYITYTLYDRTLIPIKSNHWLRPIQPGESVILEDPAIYIPNWACPGKALISVNIFTDYPMNGGFPYIPERLSYIYITRNEETPTPYSPITTISFETQPGEYNMFLRTSPDNDSEAGTYSVYTTGIKVPFNVTSFRKSHASVNFDTQSNPTPPQAAFTYYPVMLYENMTGTFDATSSSAEGYNDTIICYEWIFNDPFNPETIINEGNFTHPPSPLATHTFEYQGTYTITLNVTDNEALWSTTTKPITILTEFGPTANFTWSPPAPIVNKTVTFDANSTQLGWSLELGDYSPINTFSWNFSDGTGIIQTASPTQIHVFEQPGNYTVTLTVEDSVGKLDSILKLVEIQNITSNPYDVNGDGYVGIDDIVLTAENFGNSQGDPGWNPAADVNGDGYGGIDDIVGVAEHFGES